MEMTVKTDIKYDEKNFLHLLDRGIDDMEAGRELSLDDAFKKISELRDARRNARL